MLDVLRHEQGLELARDAMRGVRAGFFRDGSGMAGADRVTRENLCSHQLRNRNADYGDVEPPNIRACSIARPVRCCA